MGDMIADFKKPDCSAFGEQEDVTRMNKDTPRNAARPTAKRSARKQAFWTLGAAVLRYFCARLPLLPKFFLQERSGQNRCGLFAGSGPVLRKSRASARAGTAAAGYKRSAFLQRAII